VTAAYAQVAVALPLRRTFTYRIPDELRGELPLGSAVTVPFGSRAERGYVVELAGEPGPDAPGRLKNIAEMAIPGPLFPADLLAVTRWIAGYYLCSWGEALHACVPAEGGARAEPPEQLDVEATSGAPGSGLVLTPRQREVLEPLRSALAEGRFEPALLHGVTASGKTAVYEELVADALERGRGALVLVPEISITPQMIGLFRSRFGERVALFHSRLTPRRRRLEWRRVLAGEVDVVIGPRSAVLAPLDRPGVIIVDEEHENSYKQSEPAPRYHARDVAVYRARECDAVCLLGSATPSAESWHNARAGKYLLLSLPERVSDRAMPAVRLVDLTREKRSPGRWSRILSRDLEEALEARLARKEQSILFLNRRGFSPALVCQACGEAAECSSCSVAMTYHRRDGRLRCHYCGNSRKPPESCPHCGSKELRHQGLGTQRVESVLEERFPEARVLRMDSDTTRLRGSHAAIYETFARGEGDILLGTQMVAKGFHFPGVTLVGVISADAQLHFPDFRANERTFQLLVQVAGRAGRGERPGEVIIQTFSADNPGVYRAVAGDYEGFLAAELEARKALGYPPFGRMIRVLVKARDEAAAARAGRRVGERLRSKAGRGVAVLGPAPAPLYRLNRWYRVHLFLRAPTAGVLHRCVEAAELETSRGGIVIAVDADPIDVL